MSEKSIFNKGESGNPCGRPKGAINETTKKFTRIKNLASERYEEAFNLLWEAVEAKEAWAHQLYFKELVPKKVHQPTISIAPAGSSLEAQIFAITSELPEFKDFTLEEALHALKTLGNIKVAENVSKDQSTIFENLSDEQVTILNEWIKVKNG